MGVKFKIEDGIGRGNVARVEDDNSLRTTPTNIPPRDNPSEIKIYRSYLRNDAGSEDMRVNASLSSPVDFYIEAASDFDRYIDTISIVIADAGASLNDFGSINALSNGIEIFYEDSALGDVVIADSLKSNFEMLRLCAGGVHGIGSGANAYRANNVEGNSEGFLMYLDFSQVFGIPWGVKLDANSTKRLVVRIKDNTSGVDTFNMIAYGYDRVKK